MLFTKGPLSSLAASAALWAAAQASYLNSELSFGYNAKISPTLRSIPEFQIYGTPDPPQLLSNKIILTPPAPGNQRGAVWSEKTLKHAYWAVDFEFRATGPERASGNIQLWYAAQGSEVVGTASVYTVGRFDGLAVVVDQYAGKAGFVRGFLNDGTTDYKSHHSVDSLAFGHCEYAFRNLGRPSKITVRQTQDNFRVEVDGKLCFESPKIRLPTGYQLGVTAASAENPDSFEVFKVVTTTESINPDGDDSAYPSLQKQNNDNNNDNYDDMNNNKVRGGKSVPVNKAAPGDIPAFTFNDPAEEPASAIAADAQFADLHNRLQAMMRRMVALHAETASSHTQVLTRVNALSDKLTRIENSLGGLDALAAMDRKLGEIQADVRQTKSDLHAALDRQVAGIKKEVRDTHRTTLGSIAASAPSVMAYVLVVVGSQALTVVAYLMYKRRKNAGPKKYL